MIRLTSKWFCAGVVLRNGKVAICAPILRYMQGWTRQRVLDYAKGRFWAAEEI